MALSSHLLDQYEDRKPFLPPHLRPDSRSSHQIPRMMDPDTSWVSHHGPGTQMSTMPVPRSQWSEEKVAELQARLSRKLGPEFVTQRPGPGGGPKLSYIEGWKVINLANEVFGFNGWSSSITQLTVDFLDVNDQGRCSVNVTAIVRITLQDGCYHEDVGCGQGENIKGKGAALDKAKKEAVTDATKRCLKTFGNVLGNCLYDKEYTKEVVKMKVPPARFNQAGLERRPEFTENGAGPSRPQAPAQAARPAQAQPPAPRNPIPAPGSPLNEIGNETADLGEAYDMEFMDIEGESFDFDTVEQSMQVASTVGPAQTTMRPPPIPNHAGPSKPPSVQQQPVYQHRHRPDMPEQSFQPAQSTRPTNQPAVPTALNNGATARSAAIRQTTTIETVTVAKHDEATLPAANSSGGSSSTIPTSSDNARPKPVGGFIFPNGNQSGGLNSTSTTSAGQSARAAAIASALSSAQSSSHAARTPPAPAHQGIKSNQRSHQPPIRAESPQIPNGGIDIVASRATTNLRANGVHLNLDGGPGSGSPAAGGAVGYGGFASARGMKRSISEDQGEGQAPMLGQGQGPKQEGYAQPYRNGSQSPTKQGGGVGMGRNAFAQNGPRQALGEIAVDGDGRAMMDDWGTKRQRAA